MLDPSLVPCGRPGWPVCNIKLHEQASVGLLDCERLVKNPWLRRAGAGVTRADEDVLVVRAGAGRVRVPTLLTRRVLRGVGGFPRWQGQGL